jgi:DNA-binding response OmpR family regulator
MCEGLARKKQLDYMRSLDPDAPTLIWADVKKVERILGNLIGNSLKFTPEVGRIIVSSGYADGMVKVVISDTGPGIPVEEQETIFERYQQGSSAADIAQPGYGIGLALCREYTVLMDGKLWVESTPGKGASFILNLPAKLATIDDVPQESNEVIEVAPETFAQFKNEKKMDGHVLLVEDHPDLLAFLQQALEEEFTITTAVNGQQAWDILQKDDSIDLILSDAMMPIMDGFTLLQKTRSHGQLGVKSFILLTSLAEEDDRLKGLRLGVDAYITKPFDTTLLKLQINNQLRQHQARKEHIVSDRFINNFEQNDSAEDILIGYDAVWMNKLEDIVKNNMHKETFKVPDMAEAMNASERSLFNILKTYTGLAPSAYLRKARLQVAMKYIQERKFTTTRELAFSIGVKDPRNFSYIFKNEYGKTPKEMMQSHVV